MLVLMPTNTINKMTKNKYTPPQTFTHDRVIYSFKESKMVNSKGEKLSEPNYWFTILEGRDKGKDVPLVEKQIEWMKNN
jgi:hypothetical protein